MSDISEIPYEFREAHFSEYVRYVTASAIISAQYVEKVFKGIALILNPDEFRYTLEDFMSGDSSKTKQTLGMINMKLNKKDYLDPSFSDRLSKYIQRRNRVVHGLFADTFNSKSDIHIDSPKAKKYVAECEWIAEEGAQLVEVGFGIYSVLGRLIKPPHPHQSQLNDILNGFDEFHELGIKYIFPSLLNRKID